jgi:hypothetical protein
MSLQHVQLFLTTYLRNPEFRRRYRAGEADALRRELNLDEDDARLVAGIDLDDLDRAALGMRDERRSKREAEFKEFTDHLAAFGPMDSFFEQFDAAYPDGLLSRPLELDRFLAFAAGFVLRHNLPEYLIDILRLCYHYTQVSDLPLERSAPVREGALPGGLQPFHRLHLRAPYRVCRFRYDVLTLARAAPHPAMAGVGPFPVEVLIQKDWSRFKETRIFYTSSFPPALLRNERLSVLDLLATLPTSEYPHALGQLQEFHSRGVIDVLA